jgi:MFS family permease
VLPIAARPDRVLSAMTLFRMHGRAMPRASHRTSHRTNAAPAPHALRGSRRPAGPPPPLPPCPRRLSAAPCPASRRRRPPALARAVAAAAAAAPAAPADRAFVRTVVPTALALALCNMDRMCLSVAMLPIAREMAWPEGVQGLVQSAFLWGYLANQLLGGTLADRHGGKAVMAAGIAFFSLASMLLPALAISPATVAAGVVLPAVLAARFLVGFGEGVALPSMSNLMATRIAPAARATATGAVFFGFQAGNLVALAAAPAILQRYGWRALFYMFGALGAPLLAMWLLVVPPPPAPMPVAEPAAAEAVHAPGTAPAASEAAGAAPAASGSRSGGGGGGGGGPVTLRALLSSRAVWAIIAANVVNHWGYFIYLNWMPTYFYKVMGERRRACVCLRNPAASKQLRPLRQHTQP